MRVTFSINSRFYIDFLLYVSCNYVYGNKKATHWYKEFKFRQYIIRPQRPQARNSYFICG